MEIRVENLTRRFGTLTAVSDLNLNVGSGEIFGLVGPDGAGKTTTIRMLAGILDATSGAAWVGGHHCTRDLARLTENIGYMSQGFGQYADLSIDENITFFADLYDVPRRTRLELTKSLLHQSGLLPFRRRLAMHLSGGMKQKLALICALIHSPKVLFLDEPTNGVDPISRRDFWNILKSLKCSGVTIFVSTSYLDEAEYCDRVGLMHNGRLIACETPALLKDQLGAKIIEVCCSTSRNFVEELRERLESRSIALFGDRVHIVAEDVEATTTRVRLLAKEFGISALELRILQPSLEDVFIARLKDPDREYSHAAN